jgi:hypothetical protein
LKTKIWLATGQSNSTGKLRSFVSIGRSDRASATPTT